MNRNRTGIATYAAIGIMATGLAVLAPVMDVHAATLSNQLPSAGFSIAVDEGTSVKDVKEEVKDIVATPSVSVEETESKENQSEEATATEEANKVTVEKTIDFDKEVVDAVVRTPGDMIADDAREDFSNLVIAQVTNYVNVRDIPDENEGKIVGKLYDKSVGEFIEEKDGWYKIESGSCTGWVKGEFCVTGDEAVELAKEVGTLLARVNTTTLKVREEPGLDTTVLGLVPIDDELLVVEELDGWIKVDIEEGFGFVSDEYVDLHTEFVKAESKEEEEIRLAKEKAERDKANAAARAARANQGGGGGSSSYIPDNPITHVSGSGSGAAVCNYALQFVGNPYVYGGSSLTHGTDCSGFVMSVYGNFGVGLPHSSAADRSVGYDVGGIANAQPGDIVCYSGHVAIYIGNGQIVHASTAKTGIIVSSATYRTPLCVRRIF
ncbi:MAG: C40 family peptidase [Lachnospiraceae bacterium]|nr:C40 family peptidase [Lachnospiraceae bacterium]